jgi:23S rRNA pseudouridine1911/1915/1917 synthase
LIQRLIDEQRVRRAGQVLRSSQKVRNGDRVELELPPPQPLEARPQALELTIVYEDPQLLVVDKPAGLVVHPAPGHPDGTLVNGLLHHCGAELLGIGNVLRPGIVHRIDRDTSGLLVVAKDGPSHDFLAALFKRHAVQRQYRAVVHGGRSLPVQGTFATSYGRHPTDRKRFSSLVTRGRRAVTHWQVVEQRGPLAVVTVRLETGRSHQIRVHFAEHGHPLVGDPVYGGSRADHGLPPAVAALVGKLGRQALHAELLGFPHPLTGVPLLFQSALPPDLAGLLDGLRRLFPS